MTYETASETGRMLGVAFTPDSVIITQPQHGQDGDAALYATRAKPLSAEEQRDVLSKVLAAGLDATTTVVGKDLKFFYFGPEEAMDSFVGKVAEVVKSAGLSEPLSFEIGGEMYEAEAYDTRGDSGLGRQAWLEDAAARPPGLFRRAVDTLVVPYARAVAGEGYRLSLDRFGKRFDLSQAQVEYLRDALRPLTGKERSAARLLSVTE